MRDYVIESILSQVFHRARTNNSAFYDMKAFFQKFKKPKHPSLPTDAPVSKPGEPRTSTSTMMTSTGDPRPFVPTGSGIASAQVIQAADVTVSAYRSYKCNHSIIIVDQTSQLGVSASASTSAIDGIVSVAHVEEHHTTLPSSHDTISQRMESQRVSWFSTCLSASAYDQQNQYSESNAPNVFIPNGTIVSLVGLIFANDWAIIVHRLTARPTFIMLMLAKSRSLYLNDQTPVNSLLAEEVHLTSLRRFFFIVRLVARR